MNDLFTSLTKCEDLTKEMNIRNSFSLYITKKMANELIFFLTELLICSQSEMSLLYIKGEVNVDNIGQHITNKYAEHPLLLQDLHQF